MNDCLFCKIIAGEIPALKIFENERVLAIMDIGPVSRGHTLVMPKNHAADLAAGSVEDSIELIKVIHELAPKIVKALGAAGYNLGMNHGEAAGQDVMHTHFHIMPRYAGEARTFIKTYPAKEELEIIAAQIKAGL